MSIEQYQRTVNLLDKEIANLEKKKADADKKVADAQKKESSVSIQRNASPNTVKVKMRQIDSYRSQAVKAASDSANLAKQIAEKRSKRSIAAIQLQKEEEKNRKQQEKAISQMKQSYERQIGELQAHLAESLFNAKVADKSCDTEYDVFVSHAWEDKGSFVDEFVNSLRDLGLKVWYDTSEIKWGDSMRRRIDDGLKKSRFGVAILSPDYIAEGKYWTKAELDGLFQLESISGKTLLPIWHNLNKADVMAFSPIIASKLAMSTATMTPQEIAKKLQELLADTEEDNYGKN